jgi:predicted dehydrogenase
VQILRANGCRVIGVDLDATRIAQARAFGMEFGLDPESTAQDEDVARLTGGIGADGVIITAATESNAVISSAFRMCRKKGRVVLVGNVGLHLNRAEMFEKELDFFISTSYGPGRYDARYEEHGLDYPVGYVRWTENRNMAEYLRLVADGRVVVAPLIERRFPIADVTQAFEALQSNSSGAHLVLLEYPSSSVTPARRIPTAHAMVEKKTGAIGLAVVGAGNFAKGMHLPNLHALPEFHLHAVVSRTGHNALQAARQFGASYASTDYDEVLRDPNVEAVLIATRPNLHTEMALRALAAGKHVLVEKPPAIYPEELAQLRRFFDDADAAPRPLLMTGFNRRFSPIARQIRDITQQRSAPMMLNYRMNAGYIPDGHWVYGDENRGRNIGEACHIYDLFTFLTDSRVVDIAAQSIRSANPYYRSTDNFVATIRFEDGSVATLTYTALGTPDYPKEHMEIFVDGKVLTMNDYKHFDVIGSRAKGSRQRVADKGQKEQLRVFAAAIRAGGDWPTPLWQQLQAMEIAFAVEAQL